MPSYILRDLDQVRWDRFKARAMQDGWHLRGLFNQLMDDYAAGVIKPSASAKPTPASGFTPARCPNGHESEITLTKKDLLALPSVRSLMLHCPVCTARVPLTDDEYDNLESWVHTKTK